MSKDEQKGYDGPTGIFINNEWHKSSDGKTFRTINPANETVIAEVQQAGQKDVDLAVAAASHCFNDPDSAWRKLSKSQRRDLMLKLADYIERDADSLAVWESADNGKPIGVARNVDIGLAIKCFRYYAGWADKQQGKTVPIDGDFFCYTLHEPVGVVGQIIPWNFPILMLAWKLGPALATGCTVVMKPSEKTPLTALMICELIKEAGFPPGVVNMLPGYGPGCGEHIVTHPLIDKVAFTGSTLTGRKVAAAAGAHLKRLSLELGGKSPLIVFPDADLDTAVTIANVGVYLNSGQCCIAGTRVFVHEDIYDEFINKAAETGRKQVNLIKHKPNGGSIFDLGPIVDDIQFKKVMQYIASGKEQARLVCGGGQLDCAGYWVQPTVFADVTDDMKIAKEEIFGPVMSVLKFKTTKEVIKRANDTAYGLGAGIITKDITTALSVSKQIRAGTVYINCYDVFDSAAPFGGFKNSGIGRELGEYGLHAYTEVKTVIIPTK